MDLSAKEIEDRCILFVKSGSHAYGLNTETSDIDYKGITIAPLKYYFTSNNFEQKDKGFEQEDWVKLKELNYGKVDCVIYELQKFISLLETQNPNIIEMLWQDEEDILYTSDSARYLLANREYFLSQKIAMTFSGYARSQVKRMLTHRKWVLKGEVEKPNWSDFGVDVDPLSKSELNAFLEFLSLLLKDKHQYYYQNEELSELIKNIDWKSLLKQYTLPEEDLPIVQQYTRASKEFISLLHASQRYREALREYDCYIDWKTNRNPVRADVEAKCGYDGKNMSHCIRLLKMAYEALTTGKLIVNRKIAGDSEQLLEIKRGEWQYEDIHLLAEQLFIDVNNVVSRGKSVLPKRINKDRLDEVCYTILGNWTRKEIF